MTNMTNPESKLSRDLKTLMSMDDSPRQKLGTFIHCFIDAHGYDPTQLYCIATGKVIGTLAVDEVESLLEDIGGDIEEQCDEYAIRLLASLRPSIRWNKMREETLDHMRRVAPIDTAAYLLNRMIAPVDSVRMPFDDRLQMHADRIRLHASLVDFDATHIESIIHMLIEVDAKTGLDKLAAPNQKTDESLFECVARFYRTECAAYAKRVEADRQMQRWTDAGSPLAKKAYTKIFMETNPSKAKIKKQAKAEDDGFMDNLLDSLLEPEKKTIAVNKEVESITAAKPFKAPPMRLGKLNLARKG